MSIETSERPPTAQEWREGHQAKRRLARMTLMADAARLAEEAELPFIRERMAKRYRDIVGVSVERKEAFRQGLERILAGADLTVQELIELLLEPPAQVKGSGAGGSSSSD